MPIPVAASVVIDSTGLPTQPFLVSQSVGPYQVGASMYVVGLSIASEVVIYKSEDLGLTWAQVANAGSTIGGSLDSAFDGATTIWLAFADGPGTTGLIFPFDCSTDTLGAVVNLSPFNASSLNICPIGSSDAVVLYQSVGTSPGNAIRLESYSGSVSLGMAGPGVFGKTFTPATLAVDGSTIYASYYDVTNSVVTDIVVATISGGVIGSTLTLASYTSSDPSVFPARGVVWHSKLIFPAVVGAPGDPSGIPTTVRVYSADIPLTAFVSTDLEVMAQAQQIGPTPVSVTTDDQLALFWVRDTNSIQYALTSDPTAWPAGSLFYDQTGEVSPQRSLSGGAMPDGTYGLVNTYNSTEAFIGSEAANVLAYCY